MGYSGINLVSAGVMPSGILIADQYSVKGGSSDSISTLTQVSVSGINMPVDAALEIQSITGGLLIPRVTTAQKNAMIVTNGFMVYDLTLNAFNFYENGAWISLASGTTTAYYVLLKSEPSLTNSFNLDSLASGLLAVTQDGGGAGIASLSSPILFSGSNGISSNNNLNMSYRGTFYSIAPDSAGQQNTSFGVGALQSLTPNSTFPNASSNTAFGQQALAGGTTCFECTAIGFQALGGTPAKTTGDFNVCLGSTAGGLLSFGASNTLVGSGAGFNMGVNIGASSGNNVFIGDEAGGGQSQYNNCTFVGTSADANAGSLSNAMGLGYQAIVPASNYTVIGNSSTTTTLAFGQTINTRSATAQNTTATLSATQVFTNSIITCSGTGQTLTLPSASSLYTAMGSPPVNSSFTFTIANSGGGNTLASGTNNTLVGSTTLAAATVRTFTVVVTNASTPTLSTYG